MSLPKVDLDGRLADEWTSILQSAGFSVEFVPKPGPLAEVEKAFVISRGPDVIKGLWIGPPDSPIPALILVIWEGPTASQILKDVLATFESAKNKCANEH